MAYANLCPKIRVVVYFLLSYYCVCLILTKIVPTRAIEQRNIVGAMIKIMWEEQLVDPPIACKKSVNAL